MIVPLSIAMLVYAALRSRDSAPVVAGCGGVLVGMVMLSASLAALYFGGVLP